MSFKCPVCKKIFSKKESLEQHRKAVHMFECPICNRIFPKKESLEQHRNAVHVFECPFCKKVFSKKQSLEQHQNDTHLKKRLKHIKMFKTIQSLQHGHAKNHEKEPTMKISKTITSIDLSPGEPIVKQEEDLTGEISGFKCPDCGCEKAVYIRSHEPLFSKRSDLIIKCSRCGKGFRDTDF